MLPQVALSFLCKINEYIVNSYIPPHFKRLNHDYQDGIRIYSAHSANKYNRHLVEHLYMGVLSFLVNKYNRTLGKAFVDGRSCVFAVNKYNRTLGKAFVDGRFYAFAVNSVNFGSDNFPLPPSNKGVQHEKQSHHF
jgi:hypothetical protein